MTRHKDPLLSVPVVGARSAMIRRQLRSASAVALLALLFVAAPVGETPSASAACSLSDARTLESFRFRQPDGGTGLVELRHSRRCDQGWARVTDGLGCNYFHCETGVLDVSYRADREFPTGYGQRWSSPESFRHYMRACVRISDGSNPAGRLLCTAWR